MIHFQWWWILLALPLPILVYWLPKLKSSQIPPLPMPFLVGQLPSKTTQETQSRFKLLFLAWLWILLVVASARPQWLGEPVNLPTKSREMMIAVDLSGSMQIEDMTLNGNTVNRLEMLKAVLGDFIKRRKGDRLGLILFADDAYMQTPMTFDRKTVQQMLDEAVLGLVGQKTAIGDAIALAAKRFDQKKQSNKVLLLLTDGQNTAGKIAPLEALELAKAKNITIYTIGIGADEMIQNSLFGMRRVNPSAELDEKLLTKLAEETHGQYFRARNTESMEKIYQLLDQLEPVEQEQQHLRPLTALYYYPLALAIISLLVAIAWQFIQPYLANFSLKSSLKEQKHG